MKLLKPSWVNHEDKPIFSVDIHPAGKRFATGGQGGDSGRVVVWNMSPVLFETCELDPEVPKMLCQMDNHLACVNCVRWSNNGRYLASGGDDRLVMVWALSGSAAGTNHKAETWRCVSTLRGHAGDVLDLAWSPLDKWLASCSVDNSIIIWNAEKFPDMVCVLNGHTGLVKGVAWDPVGKYLASQSDDKSLRVWKTADWVQESVITEPFEECGGTTHVLRLSWSPDGQYVVSAHAMNGGGPTALVLERDGWRCDKDFVGHRRAVTCARFNSNIFVKDGKKCCCAAVGSRDRALSIWLTSLKRPLVVVHELFTDSVLDISWSSDGLNLLACSSDGSVACIQFTNKEIGTPLTLDEKNAFYEKIYGKCLTQEGGDHLANSLLLECPEILLAREKTKDELNNKLNNSANKINTSSTPLNISRNSNSSSLSPVRPIDRQIETRTSDGKRRITPVFIPNIPLSSESLGSAPTGPDACFSTSSQSKSRIRVERRDDIVIAPNVSNFSSASNHATGLSNKRQDENTTDNVLRKRPALPGAGPTPPAGGAPPLPPAAPLAAPINPPPPPVATGPVVRPVGPHCRIQVVNNAVNTPYGALSRIQLLQNNSASTEPLWETYLGSAIVCVCTSPVWVLVATCDGTLHAWRLTGLSVSRAMPPIALLSRPTKMCISGGVAAVATCNGELAMFDVTAGISLQRPPAFTALLTPAVTLTNLTLLDDGNPMITLSNGRCYIYCKRLCAWIVWQDSLDPIWRASRGSSVLRPPRTSQPLYQTTKRHVPPDTHTNRGTYAAGATRAWLEAQTSACLQLRLADDYRHWTMALLTHLATHGTEQQLRAILDDMIGPSHCTSTPKKWQSTVLGIKKHDIVEEMLTVLVRQLRWQRLYTEYHDQLTLIRSTSNGVVNGH